MLSSGYANAVLDRIRVLGRAHSSHARVLRDLGLRKEKRVFRDGTQATADARNRIDAGPR